jgi:hypothetical protein
MSRNGHTVDVVDRLGRDLDREERILAALEDEIRTERRIIAHVEADVLDLRDAVEALPARRPAEPKHPKEPTPPKREGLLGPIVSGLVVLAFLAAAVVVGVHLTENATTTSRAVNAVTMDPRWIPKQAWATAMSTRNLPTPREDARWTLAKQPWATAMSNRFAPGT